MQRNRQEHTQTQQSRCTSMANIGTQRHTQGNTINQGMQTQTQGHHFHLVGVRGAVSGPEARKAMAKIASAAPAVIFGYLKVQDHHLVTPPGMLHRALMGGFDS